MLVFSDGLKPNFKEDPKHGELAEVWGKFRMSSFFQEFSSEVKALCSKDAERAVKPLVDVSLLIFGHLPYASFSWSTRSKEDVNTVQTQT